MIRRAATIFLRAISSLLPAASLLFHGCTTQPEPIKGSDQNVFFPMGRLTFPILREQDRGLRDLFAPEKEGEESAPPPQTRGSFAIDLDYIYGRGSSSQSLGGLEYVALDGGYILGPQEVRETYEFHGGSAAVRGGGWFAGIVGLEGILGIGINSLALTASSGDKSLHDDLRQVGALLGGQLSVRPLKWLTFYGRGSMVVDGETDIGLLELGGDVSPLPGIGIMAGWQWWDYERNGAPGESDVELDMSGPMVGLHLTF